MLNSTPLGNNSYLGKKLYLAPMEGVGSVHFRKAIATIGGFDEACTEFLRVPLNPHIPSLARAYSPLDTAPILQAAQIMGSDPIAMGEMTDALIGRGAPRIDLNCGCPSNIVTGRGAGSSLLKTPDLLFKIGKAMVSAAKGVPISIKLRAGFSDTLLFKENLLAAQETGAMFITLHARTKADGYTAPANWNLITEAKQLLKIPVIGNGDICSVNDAIKMLTQTNCDGLMIGRRALIDPWIFQEIKAFFHGQSVQYSWEAFERYVMLFYQGLKESSPIKNQINQLKQLFRYFFDISESLLRIKKEMLTSSYESGEVFLKQNLPPIKEWYKENRNTLSSDAI